MTYIHVQQLAEIRNEFDAALASLAYVHKEWHNTRAEPEIQDVSLQSVKKALNNLEVTYTLRAFIQFEALLKEHLEARHLSVPYRTEDLINSVARRQRPPILGNIRDQAQEVRLYRNRVVHSLPSEVPALDFKEALKYLNQFLDRVADIP